MATQMPPGRVKLKNFALKKSKLLMGKRKRPKRKALWLINDIFAGAVIQDIFRLCTHCSSEWDYFFSSWDKMFDGKK